MDISDSPASWKERLKELGYTRKSKGQKAMEAVRDMAMNHKSETAMAKEAGCDQSYISIARLVWQYIPDQVDDIIEGRTSLTAAAVTAKARKAVLEAAAKPTLQQLKAAAIDAHNRKVWEETAKRWGGVRP